MELSLVPMQKPLVAEELGLGLVILGVVGFMVNSDGAIQFL